MPVCLPAVGATMLAAIAMFVLSLFFVVLAVFLLNRPKTNALLFCNWLVYSLKV